MKVFGIEAQESLLRLEANIRRLLRCLPSLRENADTTQPIRPSYRSSLATTGFDRFFGELSLAEVTFLGKLTEKTAWNLGCEEFQIPRTASWALNLGPEFVQKTTLTYDAIKEAGLALKSLKRKTFNAIYFDWLPRTDIYPGRESNCLPAPKGSSAWVAPLVPPSIITHFDLFEKEVHSKFVKLLKVRENRAAQVLYRHGLRFLRDYHNSGKLCVTVADKGYGFCIVGSAMVQKLADDNLSNPSFERVTPEEFLRATHDIKGWLSWKLSDAKIEWSYHRQDCLLS